MNMVLLQRIFGLLLALLVKVVLTFNLIIIMKNKIDISFIIDGKKYTMSLANHETEKRFVGKIDKDDNIQQIFQDNFETNIDKRLVSVNIITTYPITDGLIVEGVVKINKPVLFDGKIL